MRLELILNACNAFVLPNLTITPYLINTHTLLHRPPPQGGGTILKT